VQQFGLTATTEFNTKKILLLHGTGSSAHSWRDVAPLLALRYQVLAIDLPGHGFTSMPPAEDQSLNGMARKVGELMRVMSFEPTMVIGHSAGAAVAARMILNGAISPTAMVSINGAFLGFGGLAGQIFSPIARLLAAGPFASRLFAWQASDASIVEKLVRSTGSVLDPLGMKLYAQLVRNPGHVSAALAMMAHWDLDALERDLPELRLPVWLAVAENDLTVPPSQATQVARLLPNAHRVMWPMLGHLAHEESPAQCVKLVDEVMKS
jgi:magnesium chelatase accessory protein